VSVVSSTYSHRSGRVANSQLLWYHPRRLEDILRRQHCWHIKLDEKV